MLRTRIMGALVVSAAALGLAACGEPDTGAEVEEVDTMATDTEMTVDGAMGEAETTMEGAYDETMDAADDAAMEADMATDEAMEEMGETMEETGEEMQ